MLNKRVQILFDQTTYDLVSSYANNMNLTFSEALRNVARKTCKTSKNTTNKRKLAFAKVDKIRQKNKLHLTFREIRDMIEYGRH